jgi:hypothetical protein
LAPVVIHPEDIPYGTLRMRTEAALTRHRAAEADGYTASRLNEVPKFSAFADNQNLDDSACADSLTSEIRAC